MFSINFRKRGLTLRKIYFDDKIERSKFKEAVIEYYQSKYPFKGAKQFENLFIDLTQCTENLFSQIKKGTRYEINRAEKDENKIEYKLSPTNEEIKLLKEKFDVFAQNKHIGLADSEFLFKLAELGYLCMTLAKDKSEKIEVYHVYILDWDLKRVRLLYSFRIIGEYKDNSFSSRQNRLLHWKDFMFFKELGFNLYDWGGAGTGSPDVINVTKFKLEFGGYNVIEYNGKVGNTFIGKIIVTLYNILYKKGNMKNKKRK